MDLDSQPDSEHSKQINLQQVAGQFMTGLQRHFDMLAFNIASRDAATEEAYNKQCALPRIMPATQTHQNFEQMQAYARDLLIRQVVGDALNLAVSGLNNAHFFLALIKATNARSHAKEEEQKQAQQSQQSFLAAQLDEKFNRLEKDYGILCELEDSITSLGLIMQALMQQKGQVRSKQTDESGELALDLKTIEIKQAAPGEKDSHGRLVDTRKVFREGDYIFFGNSELQLILVMIAAFADALFKSVARYARTMKEDT